MLFPNDLGDRFFDQIEIQKKRNIKGPSKNNHHNSGLPICNPGTASITTKYTTPKSNQNTTSKMEAAMSMPARLYFEAFFTYGSVCKTVFLKKNSVNKSKLPIRAIK